MAIIGYARVSTQEQNLDLQLNALMNANCDYIFEDHGVSAVANDRAGFNQALEKLEQGDIFVVWKMDRAFRSVKNAMDILDRFEKLGVEFRCLTEIIDTSTPMGKFTYQIRNAFSELERSFIRERTIAGMEAAKARGALIGRPRKLTAKQISQTRLRLIDNPNLSKQEEAGALGVSVRTLNRALEQLSKTA